VSDPVTPLITAEYFTEGPFGDLVAKYSEQALADVLAKGTRLCEDATQRRLAPFTITETTRADGIDPDEYPAGADMPMPIQGTIGWSQALSLGGNDLVRHCWLSEYPPRYPDLWEYSDISVTVIRSYAGTETLQQAQVLDGPDNTGHLWFQIGTLVPVGSRVRPTYSGGYTVATPASLAAGCEFMCAYLVVRALDPEAQQHDPAQLHADALMALGAFARS
jgi:hypothetical protein